MADDVQAILDRLRDLYDFALILEQLHRAGPQDLWPWTGNSHCDLKWSHTS
jgi:hypothetical protein